MTASGKSHGSKLYFMLNSKDISAYVESVDGLPGDKELADVTVGGSVGHKWFPGLVNASIALKCVYDDATDSAFDVMKGFQAWTAAVAFIYCPAGNVSGYVKITGSVWVKNLTIPEKATDVLTFNVTLECDGDITITTVGA